MAHPPRIPVWLPLDKSVIYFVTICVQHRHPVLANPATFNAFQSTLAKIKRWNTIAATVMPDHLHILTWPVTREEPVGDFSALLKRWMRQELRATWDWQPGCFDHLLRSDESAQEKWLYLRENPVRAGLVKDWHEWPYTIGFRRGDGQSTEGKPAACPTNPPL